ncbi:putative peptidoglycan binding protein (LysM domain involved in cell wall degradation) [Fulvimarina pelagi HTCC2506]|uniref:Peptidoglycan binding protein, Lysm domain n=2 Tax=Fulvimarina pelagi TaxID=217511 RepID=A0A0P0ZAD2_9HYPH|nr:LysM peptidoglycan-binding domain-containing protein [Fulvimarina pelagi]EAU40594.1 putative peptidoglycan binding protein (LysM domain involved in cell wall degradation) [Fulvimarina pelagi HTCC2506]BAT31144.1 peptidoglycan binding protein, Lysm domain [Fulvimarina pelagi]
MKRKVLGIIVAFFMIIGAIVAGYWDMLVSERAELRSIAQKAFDRFTTSDDASDPAATGSGRNTGNGSQVVASAENVDEFSENEGTSAASTSSQSSEMGAENENLISQTAADEVVDVASDTATLETDTRPTSSVKTEPSTSQVDEDTAANYEETGVSLGRSAEGMEVAEAKSDTLSDNQQTPSADATGTLFGTRAVSGSETADQDVIMFPRTPSDGDERPAVSSDRLQFDVLRVEPDGSMVVAGRGPSNSTIYLEEGGKRIGSDQSGPGGDFVVILSQGLATGAHAIKLVAETEGGDRAVSEETAIVDVPDRGEENQLLALVESPDAPARLIDIPAGENAAAGSDRSTDRTGSRSSERQPNETATNNGGSQDQTTSDASSPAIDDTGEAAQNSGSSTGELLIAETSNASDGEPTDVVLLPLDKSTSAPAASDLASDALRVEAIEIEGDRIFVAGAAPGGANVRIYLDNELLAESRSSGAGRFLIDASSKISVGDHTVRVDQLDVGGEVEARVAVPFSRPDAGAMSAISPSLQLSNSTNKSASLADADGLTSRRQASDGSASLGTLVEEQPVQSTESAARDPVSTSSTPSPEKKGDRSSTTDAYGGEPEISSDLSRNLSAKSEGSNAALLTGGDGPENIASETFASIDPSEGVSPLGSDERVQGTNIERPASTTRDTSQSNASQDVAAVESSPAANASAAETTPQSENETGTGEPKDYSVPTRIQAPLETQTGRVLIRKGDTLWQISRENYGQGTRYTVIYLANGDQIRDPNLIYPGQIFQMPPKSTAEVSPSSETVE